MSVTNSLLAMRRLTPDSATVRACACPKRLHTLTSSSMGGAWSRTAGGSTSRGMNFIGCGAAASELLVGGRHLRPETGVVGLGQVGWRLQRLVADELRLHLLDGRQVDGEDAVGAALAGLHQLLELVEHGLLVRTVQAGGGGHDDVDGLLLVLQRVLPALDAGADEGLHLLRLGAAVLLRHEQRILLHDHAVVARLDERELVAQPLLLERVELVV